MAIYTTIFALTRDELHSCFPDLRVSLDVPEIRVGQHPFTGESIQLENWDPGSDLPPTSLFDSQGRPRVPPLRAPETDYARSLESAVEPLIATFPHLAWKQVELTELAEAILGFSVHQDFFFDCPEDEGCLEILPGDATRKLPKLSRPTFEALPITGNRRCLAGSTTRGGQPCRFFRNSRSTPSILTAC